MAKYHQGFFKPLNPKKYKGDPTQIVYRSRWEFIIMREFDTRKDILEWSSEEHIVYYTSPIDGKVHRYFPDFWIKKKNFSNGEIEECLIEVKPKHQTKPPKIQTGKPTRKYINEVKTWGINSSKWEAANKVCNKKGWKFVIITEDDLNLR